MTTKAHYTGVKAVQTPRFYKQWMLAGNPSNFTEELIRNFGDFVHYRGLIEFYLINDPDLIKQVLRDTHRSFDKNTVIYNRFRNALGNSLVNAEGKHWQKQRRLIQPAFGPKAVKSFYNIMVTASQDIVDRWQIHADNQQSFDVSNEMNLLTLEIAGKSLFSDGFTTKAADIRRWTQVINRYSAKPPLPIVGHPDFPTPMNLQLKRVLKEYSSFIHEMINRRMKGGSPDDLLSVFLSIEDDETGEKMEISEIAEEVLGMIIGGHETSSTALTWIFYELHKHPKVEAKLNHELQHVTANKPLQFEQVTELRYMKAVIEEAMRLHPPLWFENRNTKEDVKLGNSVIPQGSMVALSRYALQRNPKVWERPNEFDPTRFLSEDNDAAKKHKADGAYIPFSSGPRVCIGRHFAMMELMVILSTILQNYEIKVSTKNTFKVAANLTMELRDGLLIELTNRK
ncbi:MAG: cytochrome P450 [Verrucomicrobiota bacterium]